VFGAARDVANTVCAATGAARDGVNAVSDAGGAAPNGIVGCALQRVRARFFAQRFDATFVVYEIRQASVV
jgi:hypothetical protein